MFKRKKAHQPEPVEPVDEHPVVDTVASEPASLDEPPPVQRLAEPEHRRQRQLPPMSTGIGRATSVGQGVIMEGTLRFKGQARIDGTFRGIIADGQQLEVGPEAEVEADVNVTDLLIQGKVAGNISARESVEIRSGGNMRGDIRTPAFHVHRGAFFNGHCKMGD